MSAVTHAFKVLGRGTAALRSPPQGLGCMGLSAFYSTNITTSTDEEKIAFLRAALSKGIAHLDTSDIYGPHTNEILIGKAIQGVPRDSFVLATKFAISYADGKASVRGDKAYVRQSLEASLARLGVSYIDLYYVHRIDQTVPIEETIEELALLVKEGKIKHIGLSEAHPNTIRRAHAVHPITAVQLEWSLWSRDVEEDLIPVLRELGIGIVAYSPLGRGFLTGTIKKVEDLSKDDWRLLNPRFQGEAFKSNLSVVEALEKIGAARGVTAGQIALAWVQNQGDDVVTIPGTTKLVNLESNLLSLDIKLTPEELKLIGDAIPVEKIVGERYDGGAPYRNDKNPIRK